VFSTLSLALETCWLAVRRLAFVFRISFASALLGCSSWHQAQDYPGAAGVAAVGGLFAMWPNAAARRA